MEKKAQKTTESEYILIPNPIYDVVFKYLMEDYESAVIVLSTFIGQKITDLHFEPQEFPDKTEEDNDGEHIKLFHLDFSATITRADGTNEIIIIELQKAKRPSDIFRFKRYLSKNFQRKFKKTVIDERTGAIKEIEVSYRIFPIYIFNFKIENEIKDLVITVNRHKTGLFKRMELKKESEFIENISYDMLIVQLPYINDVTPEDYPLYRMLSRTMDDLHRDAASIRDALQKPIAAGYDVDIREGLSGIGGGLATWRGIADGARGDPRARPGRRIDCQGAAGGR